jgi:hypothetical protein
MQSYGKTLLLLKRIYNLQLPIQFALMKAF